MPLLTPQGVADTPERARATRALMAYTIGRPEVLLLRPRPALTPEIVRMLEGARAK